VEDGSGRNPLPACLPRPRLIARSLCAWCCCLLLLLLLTSPPLSCVQLWPASRAKSSTAQPREVGVPVLHSEPVAFTAAAESVCAVRHEPTCIPLFHQQSQIWVAASAMMLGP
jgi:hypothetical protein